MAMGKIFARRIHDGIIKWPDDVPARYNDVTKKAYKALYGIELEG